MTVSIKRMSAGDGYRYLTRTVAAGDGARDQSTSLTRYYEESGNPPGQWIGSGLAGLGDGQGLSAGSVVTESQMFQLFGMGNDPVSGAPLGARPYRLDAVTGRGSVAGFDLTFSVSKSVSVWWALADAETRKAIYEAHQAAIADCIALLEKQVAATRVGRNGVAQAQVRGLLAAGFDHWDSRAGDPHLHTHVVLANRVQGLDGTWRTLDSRALFRSVVAVSETYHGLLADELTRRLGVTWQARARRHSSVPAWEITGVPAELIDLFSQRSHAIEDHKNDLVAQFRHKHGREPSAVEVLRLRQQATLTTRPDKTVQPLAELMRQWHDRACTVLGMDPAAWAQGIGAGPAPHGRDVENLTEARQVALAACVLTAVETKRSTWGRWNLHAEAARQLMGHRCTTPAERLNMLDRIVDHALEASLQLTPPPLTTTPVALQRSDGTSMFTHRHAEKYTSRTLLDAEARLLDAGRTLDGPGVERGVVEQLLRVPPPRHRYLLGKDQRAAVADIATCGRALDVLVGPAGTGKTVTLAGLRAIWETQHGPGSVLGMAPSATAADVLAGELGIATENTAKWLTETAQQHARQHQLDQCEELLREVGSRNPRLSMVLRQRRDEQQAQVDRWRLQPGQLVIIDEASLAGTRALDQINTQAQAVGAKVLLVGDWAQLSAVDAGGAFCLLVGDRSTPSELGAVRRFTAPWEREASRRLRVGDASVLTEYQSHGRLHDGDTATVVDSAYRAWRCDEDAGQRSLLLAADSATVTQLNQRARADLVAAGAVEAGGVALASGTIAGAGDRIVTRKNDRLLSTGHGFVKNGDAWTILARGSDGSLTVRRPTGGPTSTLSAEYVAQHVELGYATTAYRAQGATVDTTHVVISSDTMTREALYVAMTRGRHTNTAYIATDTVPKDCEQEPTAQLHPTHQPVTGREVLTTVLAHVGADLAAHTVMRAEQDTATSIKQLADEYDTIAAAAQAPRWRHVIAASGLPPDQLETVHRSPAYGALTTAMRRADAGGLPIESAFAHLVAARSLDGASDVTAVLHRRLTRWAATADATRPASTAIAGLIPTADGITDNPTRDALTQRARLIEQRARALVEAALANDEKWIRQLGQPPVEPALRGAWSEHARTVAAFRDRYDAGIHDSAATEPERAAARRAMHAAIDLACRDAITDVDEPALDRTTSLVLER